MSLTNCHSGLTLPALPSVPGNEPMPARKAEKA